MAAGVVYTFITRTGTIANSNNNQNVQLAFFSSETFTFVGCIRVVPSPVGSMQRLMKRTRHTNTPEQPQHCGRSGGGAGNFVLGPSSTSNTIARPIVR
jgi:hypothetical protein